MTTTSTQTLLDRLRGLLGPDGLLTSPSELTVYECDGYTIEKNRPDVVVFPTSTEQVVQIVRACNDANVPFLPRGAGTSLAGGCLPVGGGVMITLTRMKRILEVNTRDRYAVVEPGVVNLWLTRHLAPEGYHFAPDPSSQGACTIGGNVATNSGGPHTLKYGVTVNHVLGLELVLPDGTVVQTGGPVEDTPGYDLTGVIVGSEGTFGIATKAWVRITRNPESYRTLLGVFENVDDATNTISDIIGAGIVPGALEMLDQLILQAVEAAFHFGFPLDAGAVLIMEVDGLEAGLEADAQRIAEIALRNHAREVRRAATTAERLLLWKCRKQAFGAVGRLAPSYCTQDGVVPRTKLPHILRVIQRISAHYQIRIANVFHAGDGNIHPILLFDERDSDQVKRVLAASHEILEECIACGGSVTGEHGIGVEKIDFMPRLFTPEDLHMMLRLRSSFQPGRALQSRQDVSHGGSLYRAQQGRPKSGAVEPGTKGPFFGKNEGRTVMLLILGVGLLVLGVALCLKGEVTLPGGRLLKPTPARLAGGVLLSFFPLVILVHFFIEALEDLYIQLLNWLLALSCLGTAFVIIWKTTALDRSPRKKPGMYVPKNPFQLEGASEETISHPRLEAEPRMQPARQQQKKNPFDFS